MSMDTGVVHSKDSLIGLYLPNATKDPINVGDYGICDVDYHGDRQGAEAWRYSKVLFHWTNTGAALVLTAATTVNSFTAGTNETGADQGFPPGYKMSTSETDADKAGAMIKLMDLYEIRALGFEVFEPYNYDVTGKIVQHQQFLKDGGYTDLLATAMYDNIAIQVQFEDNACTYDLGLGRFHPPHAAVTDAIDSGKPSRNSVGMVSLAPMRSVITGARDQINKVNIALTSPNADIQILSNPTIPLPLTADLPEVIVPVMILAYGEKVCPPKQCADAVCDTPEAQARLFAQFQKFQQMTAGK